MKFRKIVKNSVQIGLLSAFVAMGAVGIGCEGPMISSSGYVAKVRSDLSTYRMDVCLDRNYSYTCEMSEDTITPDASGNFHLAGGPWKAEDLVRYPLIAELIQGNRVLVTLSSLPGQPEIISPLTTLLRVGKDLYQNRSYADLEENIINRYRLADQAFNTVLDFTTNERSALFGRLLVDTDEASDESVKSLYALYLDDSSSGLVEEQFESYIMTRNAEAGEGEAGTDTAAPTGSYSNILWKQGMDLGVGYDDINGRILSAAQCIKKNENGELNIVEGAAPMIETYSFELVHSKRDLRDLLDVEGKLSLNLDSFNLNAEAEFFRNIKMNKNSIYVFAEMEMIFRDYMIKNPRLTLDGYPEAENGNGQINGTIRNNYKDEDLELFRKRCGDRFLNVITTGGRYWALIEIETKNMADKMEISGKLSLAISQFTLKGKVEIINDELATYERVKIYVASRGAPGAVEPIGTARDEESTGEGDPDDGTIGEPVGALNQFYKNIETFKENLMKLDEPNEYGKRDYRQAAYMAKFEPYEQIADNALVRGGDVAFEAHCMQGFADLLDDYTDVEHEGQNIIENPHLYEGAFNLAKIDAVNTWLNRIALNKAILLSLAKQCAKKENRVCVDLMWMHVVYDENAQENIATFPNMETFHLDIPLDIKKAYPQPKIIYPKTCKERKELFSRNLDDEYLLYLGRHPEKKFFVYCEGMAEREYDPVEYLTLRVTSPPPQYANVRYNFSKNIDFIKGEEDPSEEDEGMEEGEEEGEEEGGGGGEDDDGDSIEIIDRASQITVFQKLRIHITDTHIAIYPTQDKWNVTNEGTFFDEDRLSVGPANYGTASTCGPENKKGANINLQGTPFRISVPDKVMFGPIEDGFYEVIYDKQLYWAEARDLAFELGGQLPIVADSEDNEFYRELIGDFYLSNGAWLGLKTVGGPMDMVIQSQEDTYQLYRWYPAPDKYLSLDYWNWWAGYNWEEFSSTFMVCVFMNPDGYWEYTDCTEERPIIVVFKRIVGEIVEETGSNGQIFDIYLRSKIGGCGSYGNIDGEIVLTYDEELAQNDPWLSETNSVNGS